MAIANNSFSHHQHVMQFTYALWRPIGINHNSQPVDKHYDTF